MRKIVRFLAILSLCTGFAGCGGANSPEINENQTSKASETVHRKTKISPPTDTLAEKQVSSHDSASVDLYSEDDSLDTDADYIYDQFENDENGGDPNQDYAADPELSNDENWNDSEGEESYAYISDEEMDVVKDKLIATSLVRVLRPDFADQRDSVLADIEKRLTITPERIPATVVVEKWKSPVNFRGYKFNQRKLILFGVREEQSVVLFYYINQYYFALDERFYELDETLAFEPFQNLADTALVRHLRAYENSL